MDSMNRPVEMMLNEALQVERLRFEIFHERGGASVCYRIWVEVMRDVLDG